MSETGLASTVFSMDLPSLGFDFKLPFFVIQGSDDHITPTSVAASYFENIKAPRKQLTLISLLVLSAKLFVFSLVGRTLRPGRAVATMRNE